MADAGEWRVSKRKKSNKDILREARADRRDRRPHPQSQPRPPVQDDTGWVSSLWDEAVNNHQEEDMSYEELLVLADILGPVKHPGFTEHEVDLLPFQRARPSDSCECPICLTNINEGVYCIKLKCLHTFHVQCLKRWLVQKATCPVCRFRVAHPEIVINE